MTFAELWIAFIVLGLGAFGIYLSRKEHRP
jgi:hypothetical protein